MEILQQIFNGLNYLAVHVPWAAVGASGVLSPLLLGVKKWFSVQSEKVMITLVLVAGLVTAGANYLLHVPAHDPSIIAVQGAVLAFMTQPFYFFVVKPIAKAVSEQLSKAAAFDAQIKSAQEPAAGLPGLSPLSPTEDFSR